MQILDKHDSLSTTPTQTTASKDAIDLNQHVFDTVSIQTEHYSRLKGQFT